jgi:hypothetical protein
MWMMELSVTHMFRACVTLGNSVTMVPGLLSKKWKEDATFCLIKDGTFFPHFLFNEHGTVVIKMWV